MSETNLKIYGVKGEITGYSFTDARGNTINYGNTAVAYSTREYESRTVFEVLEELTGQQAFTRFWKLRFEKMEEEHRELILAVFPNVLQAVEQKQNIKEPEKVYRVAKANILKYHKELVKVCSRCGGTGNYSWNQRDGSRCFGCGGSGYVLPKITKKYIEKVAEAYR